jgi:hypothetical protein
MPVAAALQAIAAALLDADQPSPPPSSERLFALDEALDRLAAIEPRAAEVVKRQAEARSA